MPAAGKETQGWLRRGSRSEQRRTAPSYCRNPGGGWAYNPAVSAPSLERPSFFPSRRSAPSRDRCGSTAFSSDRNAIQPSGGSLDLPKAEFLSAS